MQTTQTSRVKRIAALLTLILAAGLASGALTGCVKPESESRAAMQAFLANIDSGNYEAAYRMLSSDVRYEAEQAKRDRELGSTQSIKTISREQFTSRYTAIFGELGITGLSYQDVSAVEGEIICVYDYTLQYESELIGETEFQFRMTVLREAGSWVIDWSPALLFPEMEWGDTVRVGSVKATRGEILADGQMYAQTVDAVTVFAVPSIIEDHDWFIAQMAGVLDTSADKIKKALDTAYNDFTILKQYYPDQFTDDLESRILAVPGTGVDESNYGTLRNYPKGDSMAHIIGYVGAISNEELEALTGGILNEKGKLCDPDTGEPMENAAYNADSQVGKSGLEKQYEKELRGVDGQYVYIAASDGGRKQILYSRPVQNGMDLQLTIDPALQERAEVLLKYTLFGVDTAGAVIVLNPKTGTIEAMASYPSYDLNQFTRGISAVDWQALTEQQNAPMFNRISQGRYPPGSIFKPFTAAAALESGAMSKDDTFPSGRESIEDDKWTPSDSGEFGPWAYATVTRVHLNHRHSPLNMHNGIIDSDNIYFAYAALKTGVEFFPAFMDGLGFNEPPPFDLPVNSAQMKNADRLWDEGLLAESSYGQGQVLLTPLQAAVEFSAFANGGSIMEPRMIEGIYLTQGTEYIKTGGRQPAVWKNNAVHAASINTIEPMLTDVIVTGTGHYLDLTNVAGKTGTAEIGNDKNREISWFVGYRLNAGTEDARLALVMLEVPANDDNYSRTKFEIAHELLEGENWK